MSHSSHHPQKVLLGQFRLCVHKGGLKPHSFHFVYNLSMYKALLYVGGHTSLKTYSHIGNILGKCSQHLAAIVID